MVYNMVDVDDPNLECLKKAESTDTDYYAIVHELTKGLTQSLMTHCQILVIIMVHELFILTFLFS